MSDFLPRLMLVSPPLDDSAASDVAKALAALAPEAPDQQTKGDVEVSALLLRGGALNDAAFARLAAPLIAAAQARDIAVLLEDRPALLPASGADGLHLNLAEDEKSPVKALRKRFGEDVILGAGCGNSRHLAMSAGEEGADYIGFGGFGDLGGAPEGAPEGSGAADPEVIAWWEAVMTPPQVAFGAGTPEEARALAAAGPDFLALGPAFWLGQEDPAAALQALLRGPGEGA
ncbi:thiamine phosphate synthase [Pelagibius marinus]|uniref:thiamine phosphate synthase n=1 Tax=Pelagibius marinus TaxID=2762760 RepID=UPI001872C915|nr:thiamine phosphate synthase [Pelagibius marinus]